MDLEFATSYFDQFINLEHREMTKDDVCLDTTEKFCEFLGHPERACPCLHVSGSKGKGSITTMLGNILKAAGYEKVGLYRSPHVLHFSERVSEVDGPFPEEVYKRALERLKQAVKKLRADKIVDYITHFELVTVFGFLVFEEAGCDYVVYEVGSGGRRDATNVVKPTVSIINTIELEHTEFLGDTIEKIAFEKAGIIKPGVPVVVGPQQTEAVKQVFRDVAKEQKAGEVFFLPDKLTTSYYLDDENRLRTRVEELNVDLRLPGDFQAENAMAAKTAAELALPKLPEEAIKRGLEKTTLPGRFEIVLSEELLNYRDLPYLVLDGAHTVLSVEGSLATLETYRRLLAEQRTYDSCLTDFAEGKKPLLLFACGKRKRVAEMTGAIKGHFDYVILTKPGDFKAADLPVAERAFEDAKIPTDLIEDYGKAIETAFALADRDARPLVVLGSFYLVCEVKKFLARTTPIPFP